MEDYEEIHVSRGIRERLVMAMGDGETYDDLFERLLDCNSMTVRGSHTDNRENKKLDAEIRGGHSSE